MSAFSRRSRSSGRPRERVLAKTRGPPFYFENPNRQSRSHRTRLHARSRSQSSLGSRRQQDAKGSAPTRGARFTVSRLRLSAAATLMGVFTFPLSSSSLGYFRKPRNEANECEQQEVSCCRARLQHHRQSSPLGGCGASVIFSCLDSV